jgi:hypothetical protein
MCESGTVLGNRGFRSRKWRLAWLLAAFIWSVHYHHHIKPRFPRWPVLRHPSFLCYQHPCFTFWSLGPTPEAFSHHLAIMQPMHCLDVPRFAPLIDQQWRVAPHLRHSHLLINATQAALFLS